jgi:hypothetical protein
MTDHLSDIMALLTMLSLGVAYMWLYVVVNRRRRAQWLVVEQLKEKYRSSFTARS